MKWFNRDFKIPWTLEHWWKLIFKEIKDMDITIKHIYRELNHAADYLSKQGLQKRLMVRSGRKKHEIFRAILLGDVEGIPYIRGKQAFTRGGDSV